MVAEQVEHVRVSFSPRTSNEPARCDRRDVDFRQALITAAVTGKIDLRGDAQ
jgi:hypothetical protein